SVPDADLTRSQIHDGSGNEKRGDTAGAAVDQRRVLALDDVKSADAGANVDAHALGVFRRDLQARHFHRFIGCGQGKVDETAHLLDFFFVYEIQRVKILDLSSNLAGEIRRVKTGDFGYAALSRDNVFPNLGAVVAHAADQTQTSNNNPSSQLLPAFRVLTDVVNSILHRADFFRVFIRNFKIERFFKSHDQLDGVQGICAEIVNEGGIRGDLTFIHSQLLHNDLFYLLFHCCWHLPLLLSFSNIPSPARSLLHRFRMSLDILHRILHSHDFLRLGVRNFHLESFFQGHDQLYPVQRIRAQVLHKRRCRRNRG